jgi:hypothetical protein
MGSRLSEVPSGPKDQEASGSQILEPISGPDTQHTTESQPSKVPLSPRSQSSQALESMEIDPPYPQGGSGLCNDRSTTSVRSSMMSRQDI